MSKSSKTQFSVTSVPPEASEDGILVDFAQIGKNIVHAWIPGPEVQTQLVIETTTNGDYDVLNLDVTHFPDYSRFDVRFEAMSKAECLAKLRQLIQVVEALPAVGVPVKQPGEAF